MKLKRMLMVAVSVPIIIVQEYMLVAIPNVQFTVLLIILFSSVFTLKESLTMIVVYVLLDSLLMGALDPFYMVPMILGWSAIPICYNTILRHTNNEIILGVFALFFGFLYGWIFIPFNMIRTGITNFWPYLIADIPFEIIMAVTGFLTVILAFKPLRNVLEQVIDTENYDVIKTRG